MCERFRFARDADGLNVCALDWSGVQRAVENHYDSLASEGFGKVLSRLAFVLSLPASDLEANRFVFEHAFRLERKRRRELEVDERMFERGALIDWQCRAVIWGSSEDQPIFCQCSDLPLGPDLFCSRHARERDRPYGHWFFLDANDPLRVFGSTACSCNLHRAYFRVSYPNTHSEECEDLLNDARNEVRRRIDKQPHWEAPARVPISMKNAVFETIQSATNF